MSRCPRSTDAKHSFCIRAVQNNGREHGRMGLPEQMAIQRDPGQSGGTSPADVTDVRNAWLLSEPTGLKIRLRQRQWEEIAYVSCNSRPVAGLRT